MTSAAHKLTAAAARMRRTRERRRQGKTVIKGVVLDEIDIEDLVAAGVLDPALADDTRAIAVAIPRMMHVIRNALRATSSEDESA